MNKTIKLSFAKRIGFSFMMMLLTTMTAWATTTSSINVGGTDYTLFTGFTATGGSSGTGVFTYEKMVDGDVGESSSFHDFSDVAYVEFNSDEPIIPKGYIVNLYNFNSFSQKPNSWVLKAKANTDDEWAVLSSYSGQNMVSEQQYACNNDGNTPYKYFRFEASNTNKNIWLTEIRLYGSSPDVYYTHLTKKDATCTETGIKQDCYLRNDGKYFTDETGETELAESDVIDPIKPHTGEHHEATDVNIEYWQCSMCSKYFSNEGCTTEITEEETKIYRTITIDGSISGLVTSNVNQALAGATVTLTVSHLIDASTLKVNNGAVELTDIGSNHYTFTVPAADVTVTAETLSTYSFSLPDNMEMVSATNEADGNGKYISGTVITFAPSLRYSASNVSDGTSTLEPDANGVYTVTIENANINITATVVGSSTLYLARATSDFTAADGETLVGSTSHTVTIADGAGITLSGATISGGIVCAGSAEITLVGTNNVSNTRYSSAGIQIGGSGTTLTIRGDGSLTATGGSQAAGIGLGRTWDASVTAGTIVIEGGTVNANGDIGIGIGTVGNSQTATIDGISIKGGTVSASLGKGNIYYGSTATVGYIKIYDTIDMVDASKITESVTYMHDDTDVTASASDYFTIGENGDRRIIVPKDDTDYTITIADGIEHGTLTVAETAKYMETVTVTATPAFGYRFVRLIVKDAQNNDVASTNNTFQMPKGGATVSAVFEQGTHGTTEFVWGYSGPGGFVNEATIYDGVTTVNIQNTEVSYNILKYEEYTSYKFLLDNSTYYANIPYAGGTGEFYGAGNATNFSLNYDGETGYYDVTLTDVSNGKWGVSILPTSAQMDVVPDQTYTGSAITPEPLVIAGSLSLTKGTDYVYSYTNNTNVGTATVRATFQGDYESLGYVEKTFTIIYPTVTTSYVEADGTPHENITAIPLDNTMTTLAAGTYVVNSDVAYTGSVSFNGPATLILGDGATMSVNQTVNGGNALFVYADAPLTIYGQAEGTGTLTATAADMPGIFTQSNITINGGTIYASSYGIGGIGSVTIADGIVYTDGTGATYDGTLTSDEINAIANKTLTKGMNWADLKTAMTAGGTRTVTLTNNVNRVNSERIEPSGTVTLDLNGYTIDGGTSQTNPLFSVNNGVSMTITDSQTGGNLCNSGTNPTVSVDGGTLTLAAGTINAQSNGVYVFDGSFTMTGGTITGGTVSGVGLSSNGSFTMTGGSITGNDVGVDVNSATAMFIVSGNVSIVDNTTTDVSLKYDYQSGTLNPIHIGGALNEAARIGINIDDYAASTITGNVVMVFTDGLKGYGSKQNFTLNGRDGLALATTESGEIALGAIYTLTLPSAATVSGYTAEQDAPVGSVAYKVPCRDVVTINYTGAVTDGKSVRFTIPNGTITYLGSTDGQGKCITFTMPGSNATISKDADEQDYTFANITLKERFEDGNSYGLQATLDGSSLATISIPTAISVTGVTLNRTFTPGKPATLMLPFNGNEAYGGADVNGAAIYTFTGVALNETTQEWEATMTELDKGDAYHYGALVANTPYIVVPTASSITLTNGGTLCTAEGGGQETKPSGCNWTFKGTYSYMKWTTDTSDPDYNAERADEIGKAYGFAGKEKTDIEVGDFVRVASGAKIRPMGCYLLWSDTQNAARRMTRGAADSELPQRITVRLVSSNGETTAIGELDTKTGEISMDGWWTLDGIKLSGKPSQRGIYINNGRKIVIK